MSAIVSQIKEVWVAVEYDTDTLRWVNVMAASSGDGAVTEIV